MKGAHPVAQTPGPLVADAKECVWQLLHKMVPDAALTHAFDRFYRVWHRVLRGFARKCFRSRQDQDDLVQEVWLRVLTRLPTIEWAADGRRLRGWLYKLLHDKSLEFVRRRACRPDCAAVSVEDDNCVDPATGRPDRLEQCWDEELIDAIFASSRQKPSPAQRRLLRMIWLEGRPVGEAARIQGVDPERVTWYLYRTRRKLRTKLAVFAGRPFPRTMDELLEGLRK